jgi:methyl-accepting chemotaxis protein
LPVGFRVLAALGALLALLAASIIVAVYLIFTLSNDQAHLQDRNVPYAVALATAALNAKGMANDERGYLISGDREFRDELDQRLINVRTAFAAAVSSADGEKERQAAREAHAGFEQWVWALNQEFVAFEKGDRRGATKASLGPGRTLRKEYEASLAEAQAAAKTAIQLRRNSFASSGWVFVLMASLLVVLALGFAATFWLTRTLDRFARVASGSAPPATSPAWPKLLSDRGRRGSG